MSLVTLDAGHGGYDSGASKGGRLEKNDVLNVVKRVKEILEFNGVSVLLTRSDDTFVGLSERCAISNNAGSDLFISIHRNAFDESAHGQETLCYGLSGKGYALANAIQTNIIKAGIASANRGVKANPSLAVIHGTHAPAVLTELGFVDNDEDNELFDDNFEKYCKCVANGILSTLGVSASSVSEVKANVNIVAKLQAFLNDNGYTDSNGNKLIVDGVYGNCTKSAIAKMLKAVGY